MCTLSNKVPPKDKALAKKNDFWSYSLADIAKMLRKNGAERTGNHLFDEFWMDQWG
ncbi:hypothetical protein FACS189467_4340 [Bacteroidia bacterium]|nr:hypothetical protein FACS189467_4340 [Bacteroidia bacterium]